MKRILVLLSLAFTFSMYAHSQDSSSQVNFSIPGGYEPATVNVYNPYVYFNRTLSIDTTIDPEYYEMTVTIGEYHYSKKEGRRSKTYTVSTDSIEQKLKEVLDSLNIETKVMKSGLAVSPTGYYTTAPHLITTSYKLKIKPKEEVERLFKTLNDVIPSNAFKGCFANPYVSSLKLEQLKKEMAIAAEVRLKQEAETHAKTQGLGVVSYNSTASNIFAKNYPYNYNYNYYNAAPNTVGFNLNLDQMSYTYSTTINFILQKPTK